MVTTLALPYLKRFFQAPRVGKVLDLGVEDTQDGTQ
jgi:hypothetical protein